MTEDHRAFTLTGTSELLGRPPLAWAGARVERAFRTRPDLGRGAAPSRLEIVVTEASDTSLDAESFSFVISGEGDVLRVDLRASDDRGFTYALTEMAQRIDDGGVSALTPGEHVTEAPAVPLRAIQRNFSSVHEDSEWFHDREFWNSYLDNLAEQRFNRFHLSFGMQYNYGTGWESRTASDNYLCFIYPFLFDVPGHAVRAQGVDAAERTRNLASLAYIAAETRRRGMSFHLGLWNHAYDFAHDSPQWYPIIGVSPENHARYSADGLALLLQSIPEIEGLVFRVHHEGGIHEEGHEVFWDTVFTAASEAGRPLVIDMHAKGVDQSLIDAVRKPNLKPMISGKYWAEHMGLPYHQTSIREREKTPLQWAGAKKSVTGVTDGARRFTRYGYGDFLSEDRPLDFVFRVWPGTQKLLLWGDPAMARGFARHSTLGGSLGVEFCEPLFFKGRKGTGVPGGREIYADDELALGTHDWRKFSYTYLLWGRLLYNPDTPPETWRRQLRSVHHAAAPAVEQALAPLSRILPLVTVVHGASGANNYYWPEMYVDLAVSFWKPSMHYAFDIAEPRTFEGAVPFDPELFYGIGEYADDAIAGSLRAKYTPLEVATWLDGFVQDGAEGLALAERLAHADDTQTTRALVDMRVLMRLGTFFASKFRAAVAYALFRRTGEAIYVREAAEQLRRGHDAYQGIVEVVDGVYRSDLAFGVGASERGTWADRLPAMREDLYLLEREVASLVGGAEKTSVAPVSRSSRPAPSLTLSAPDRFDRGASLDVRLGGDLAGVRGATLRYRHLNQAEEYASAPMRAKGHAALTGTVPAEYTDSGFPLVLFAEVDLDDDAPILVPALEADLCNQPYLVIHSSAWQGKVHTTPRPRSVADTGERETTT